ncbi:sugar phosphate nucleotidyltransferase, partial [Candidatus Bathyarchaeota archaeon]|nr:sugar phosphate nucleotidyltransferase [Candidatus Bathyarchaeota archaeon]
MRRPTTIRRVVIPAAGLGTRLLSATKEQPKEMLPMFAREKGRLLVKPLLQLIFEQLHDFGILEFCFIVGREKRVIEDHFTPDNGYLKQLENRGKSHYVASLSEFYEKIKCSTIVWINQPEPLGFGHAVLQARSLFGEEPFLVHAGDTLVVSENHNHLERLL